MKGAPVNPLITLASGQLVAYYGSKPGHHGRVFTVAVVYFVAGARKLDLEATDGGAPLCCVDWSSVNLMPRQEG